MVSWSDEQLVAFLDNELLKADGQALEQAVASDPALAARLDALRLDTKTLKRDFDLLLDHAPALEAPVVLQTHIPTRRLAWPMMAAAASLALGVFLGSWLVNSGNEQWRDLAASYHLLYATETLAAVDDDAARIERELARVAGRLERELPIAALQALDGLTLKRAQILAYENRPLAQIAYITATGEPIALCIVAGDKATVELVSNETIRGMAAASWSKNGYGFLLIGSSDAALIDRAAQHFSATL